MRRIPSRPLILVAATAFTAAALAGCGANLSSPAALDHARASYERTKMNQEIATRAPGPLFEAEKSLQAAENAWQQEQDEKAVEHYAYLVEKKSEIARLTAERITAEAALQEMAREREMTLLEQRTREAEAGKRQAQVAASLAESRAREAEEARHKAETALQAIEKSRLQQLAEQSKLHSLEQEMSELKTKKTERGLVLTLDGVMFATGQAELKTMAWPSLQKLVSFLKENPERQADIEGHTDSVGAAAGNQALSQRRAEAVRDFLINRGITIERITARGMGADYPVASNDTESGRKLNRRVEIIIPNKPVAQ